MNLVAHDFDALVDAFRAVFGGVPQSFGSPASGTYGVCDGNKGVQWNAYLYPADGRAYLGVNLEGMKYNGWPVARFVLRELEDSRFLRIIGEELDTGGIEMIWSRDCWQAAGRVPIVEAELAPTPIELCRLNAAGWRDALVTAKTCLDPLRSYRGRATQVVTLRKSGRKAVKEVSPHLKLRRLLWTVPPEEACARKAQVEQARRQMEPLHRFVGELCLPERQE